VPEWQVIIHATAPGDLTERQQEIIGGAGRVLGYETPSGKLRLSGPVEADSPLAAAHEAGAAFLAACRQARAAVEVTEVRALSREQFEAEGEVPAGGLAAMAEVAEILDVTRQHAQQLAKRPDFPSPLDELAAGKVWSRAAVAQFGVLWERKPGRPRLKAKDQP
jgi:hypothetical protein